MSPAAIPVAVAERFWSKVDMSGGPTACWPWTAARSPKGYGVFGTFDKQTEMAHRFALELVGRPVPAGGEAMHSCDNPPCCNPAHIAAGTKAENMADMARKGRHFSKTRPDRLARGERHGMSKLTAELVREIRALPGPSDAIAARFGIGGSQVRAIRARTSWSHVQ